MRFFVTCTFKTPTRSLLTKSNNEKRKLQQIKMKLNTIFALAVVALPFSSQAASEQNLRRRLGCNVEIWTDFQVDLPTQFTVFNSTVQHGKWCMQGCGGSGGTECGTNTWYETGTMDCMLGNIYLANGGSCYGAEGSIFMKPTQDYTEETGLQYIEYQFHNSGGSHADTTTYNLVFYTTSDSYQFGETQPTNEDLSKKDKGTITFTIETTSTPPPTQVQPNFTSYEGNWVPIAQDVTDYSYSSSVTFESSTTTEYEDEFMAGLSVGMQVGFLKEQLNAQAQGSVTMTTENTFENIGTTSGTTTCSAVSCEDGRLYQWSVTGTTSNDETSTVSSCIFTCVENETPTGPQCPFGYCGDADCQCCNQVWIEGNSDPVANNLCS